MSTAKKSADGAGKRIVLDVADVLTSIVLLVMICVPLAFVIPMWIQYVLLRTPASSLELNPIVGFGFLGALGATLALAAASVLIGYVFLMRMKPKAEPQDERKARRAAKEETEIEAETATEVEEAEDLEEIGEDEREASEPDEENEDSES
jgi:hypothetical protein